MNDTFPHEREIKKIAVINTCTFLIIFEITDFHWYVVLTFGKTTEAVAVKCRLVDKYIRAAIIGSNEAISLLIVPPLTTSGLLRHDFKSGEKCFLKSTNSD